jgi:hypothetical protein
MSVTRFEIERLSLTLRGLPPGWTEGLSTNLEAALLDRLGALRPAGTACRIDHADLGVFDPPTHVNERVFVEAIATRLVEWIGRQAGSADGGSSR